jgi:diphosphomevalonate decarboxylase
MSDLGRSTARAGSNIALLKYWGQSDPRLNLPLNDSLSLTLTEACTVTTVAYDEDLADDEVYLDGERILDHRATRVSRHMDLIRTHYYKVHARISSMNSMPAGTGLASSASGFAALTVAAIDAFGEGVPDADELSAWARRGSGSACRSVPGGFVLWRAGTHDEDSLATTLFEPDWWDLRDLCVVLSTATKAVPNRQGHALAAAHPFMAARQEMLPARTAAMTAAIAARDLDTLGSLVEQESLEVQALMTSSTPACLYMEPATLAFVHAVRRWREDGLAVYLTLDAGPNPHLLCEGRDAAAVLERVDRLAPGATVLCNRPGPGVTLVEDHLL